MKNNIISTYNKSRVLIISLLLIAIIAGCMAATLSGCEKDQNDGGSLSGVRFVYNGKEYKFDKVGDVFIKNEVVNNEGFLYWYFIDGENEVAITDNGNRITAEFYDFIKDRLGEEDIVIECFPKLSSEQKVIITVDGIMGKTFSVEKSKPVVNLDVVSKPGYVFEGYTREPGGEKIFDAQGKAVTEVTFDVNTTIYPVFTPVQYTFVFNNGKDSKSLTFAFASQLSNFVLPEKEGYDFKGWYLSEQCLDVEKVCDETGRFVAGKEVLNESYLKYANADNIINLYGDWDIKKLQVRYKNDKGEIFKTVEYDYFTKNIAVISEIPASVGKEFVAWKYDNKEYTAGSYIEFEGGLRANIDIQAKYALIDYTFELSIAPDTVFEGSVIESGYLFNVDKAGDVALLDKDKYTINKKYHTFAGWRIKNFENTTNTPTMLAIKKSTILAYLQNNTPANNVILIEPVFNADKYNVEYVIYGEKEGTEITSAVLNGNPVEITADTDWNFRDFAFDYIRSDFSLVKDSTSKLKTVKDIFAQNPVINSGYITVYVKTAYYDYEFVYNGVILDNLNKKIYTDSVNNIVNNYYSDDAQFEFEKSICLGKEDDANEIILSDMSKNIKQGILKFVGWTLTAPKSYDENVNSIKDNVTFSVEELKRAVDKINSRIQLYAVYMPVDHTLEFNYDKKDSGQIYKGSVASGIDYTGNFDVNGKYKDLDQLEANSKITINYFSKIYRSDLPNPQVMWCSFAGWYDSNGSGLVETVVNAQDSYVLFPKFTLANFTVRYSSRIDGKEVESTQTGYSYDATELGELPSVVGYKNTDIGLYGKTIAIEDFDVDAFKNITNEEYFYNNIQNKIINVVVNMQYIDYKITYMKPVFDDLGNEKGFEEIAEEIGNPDTFNVGDSQNDKAFADYNCGYKFVKWYIKKGETEITIYSLRDLIKNGGTGDKVVYAKLNPFDYELKYTSLGNGRGEFAWKPLANIDNYVLTVGTKKITLGSNEVKYVVDNEAEFFEKDEYVSDDNNLNVAIAGYVNGKRVSYSYISKLKRLPQIKNVRIENDIVRCDTMPYGYELRVFSDGVKVQGTSLFGLADGSHVVTVNSSYTGIGDSTTYIDSIPVKLNVNKIAKPVIAIENGNIVIKNQVSGIEYELFNKGVKIDDLSKLKSGTVEITATGKAKDTDDCYYITSNASDVLSKQILKIDDGEFSIDNIDMSKYRFSILIDKAGVTDDIDFRIRWLDNSSQPTRADVERVLKYDSQFNCYSYDREHYLNSNVAYVEFYMTIKGSNPDVTYLTSKFVYKVDIVNNQYTFTKVN